MTNENHRAREMWAREGRRVCVGRGWGGRGGGIGKVVCEDRGKLVNTSSKCNKDLRASSDSSVGITWDAGETR